MTIPTIKNESDLRTGVEYICKVEPAFLPVVKNIGLPPLRRKKGGLKGLVEIITEQQISIHAAAAIWARVEARFAPFKFADLHAANDDDFAACGLSRPKIRTIRAVLEHMNAGHLQLDHCSQLDDQAVTKMLTDIKGIGPWTAQIYLLSNLGRCDVWPAGDLALQESARVLLNLNDRPDTRAMNTLAETWQPWRAVAARLLWSHYRLIVMEKQTL